MHESGQWIKSFTPLMIAQATPQAFGSASTYARRYGLTAVLGVIQEDDDGNSATFISEKQRHLLINKLNGHPDIHKLVCERLNASNIQSFDRITHDLFQPILNFVDAAIEKKKEASNENN
jgi:hypothetical protein